MTPTTNGNHLLKGQKISKMLSFWSQQNVIIGQYCFIISSYMVCCREDIEKTIFESVVVSMYGELGQKMVVRADYKQNVITDWITQKKPI